MPHWNEPFVYYPDAWILEPVLMFLPWTTPEFMAFWFSVTFLVFYQIPAIALFVLLHQMGWMSRGVPALAMFLGFGAMGLTRANVAIAKIMRFQLRFGRQAIPHDGNSR